MVSSVPTFMVASKFRFRGVTGTAKDTLRSGAMKEACIEGPGFEARPTGTFSDLRLISRDVGPCRAIGVANNGESMVCRFAESYQMSCK